jgi:hypothetical protein
MILKDTGPSLSAASMGLLPLLGAEDDGNFTVLSRLNFFFMKSSLLKLSVINKI